MTTRSEALSETLPAAFPEALPAAFAQSLRSALRGALLAPGDPGYEEARVVYNAMIQRRPGAIAQVADVGDIIACVNAARAAGVMVAVRGGGHNAGGLGVVDGGLVIDLRRLRGARIDRNDLRMRMRRAQEIRISLPRQAHIIDVAPRPAQQPRILETADCLPDPKLAHFRSFFAFSY